MKHYSCVSLKSGTYIYFVGTKFIGKIVSKSVLQSFGDRHEKVMLWSINLT